MVTRAGVALEELFEVELAADLEGRVVTATPLGVGDPSARV